VLVESIYAFDYHVERTDSFRQATDVLVEGYKGEGYKGRMCYRALNLNPRAISPNQQGLSVHGL
jgi:hypothetical protein